MSKTKKAIAFAMGMSLSLFAIAQFSISGKVINKKNGEHVFGAAIGLDNYYDKAQSTGNGVFEFKNLKSGQYIVRAYLMGFEKFTDTINLNENKTIVIGLTESATLMDEVQVLSTRVDDKSAMAYTTVSKEDIAKQNVGQDLPYLLNLTPSVVVTSDAGAGIGYTGIRIRGTDATRINTTINGVPVNDAESHGTFWVNMPDLASSINSIQVQRGVGSSTNGAGAFGGSLNIQTMALNEKPYASLSSSVGSFNTFKNTLNFGTGLMDSCWNVEGRLSKITSDGYIDRASSDLKSFYLSGGYYGKKTIIKAIVFAGMEKTYQAWYGIPQDSLKTNRTFNPAGMYFDTNGNMKFYSNQTDNYQQDYYQLHFSHQLNDKLLVNAALHYTYGRGYYEEFMQDAKFTNYNLPNVIIGNDTITKTNLVRQKWLDNDFYGATYSAIYTPNKKTNFTLGGAWNQYVGRHFGEITWAQFSSNSNLGDKYYSNNAMKTDFNIYLKTNIQLTDKLTSFVDVQYRTIDYSFLGFDLALKNIQQKIDLSFINPKIGFNYFLNTNTALYASYSIGNKEPNRDDFVNSTPQSRPKHETLHDIELGVKHNFKKMSFALNYYYMNYQNQLVLTGKINDVGAYTRTNIDNSYRTGVELEARLKPLKQIELSGNITLSENKIAEFNEYIDDYDTGNQLKNTYKNSTIAFSPSIISATTITWMPVKFASLSFIGKYVGSQFLDNTSNTNRQIDAYFVGDARLNVNLVSKHIRKIDFTVLVNNVFNRKYASNGYTYNYFSGGALVVSNNYYPQAGTNFMLGMVLTF